jgi:uncharacterized protein YaaQ
MNESEISRLLVVVIQMQDMENVTRALSALNVRATELASTGGFLGRRNVTLLIGVSPEQEARALLAIKANCRQRVEYVATQLEGAPFHIPLSTPITVGGATVFTFDVEQYEEIP